MKSDVDKLKATHDQLDTCQTENDKFLAELKQYKLKDETVIQKQAENQLIMEQLYNANAEKESKIELLACDIEELKIKIESIGNAHDVINKK